MMVGTHVFAAVYLIGTRTTLTRAQLTFRIALRARALPRGRAHTPSARSDHPSAGATDTKTGPLTPAASRELR